MSPPSGGRPRLYPLPSAEGRLPVSVNAAGRRGSPATPRGKMVQPGGRAPSAERPLAARVGERSGRPGAPPAAAVPRGAAGQASGRRLPASGDRAAAFAWCICLGWFGKNAAAARGRDLACPPHAGASRRPPAVSLRGAGQRGLSPPTPRQSQSQRLPCTAGREGVFNSLASVPAGFRCEALLANFGDAA